MTKKVKNLITLLSITILSGTLFHLLLPNIPTHPITEQSDMDSSYLYATISPFDNYFREAADSIEWDWKLLTAIGYVESKFDTTARSNMGARGIMQIVPNTLRALGIPDSLHYDPKTNIHAGAIYLKKLDNMFRNVSPFDERLNFILAAYNAGAGQIHDAMALAEKYGKERYKWEDNVKQYLILKREAKFFTDSVCKNGRFNSSNETLKFIKNVNLNWKKYNKKQNAHDDSTYAINGPIQLFCIQK